MKSFRRAGYRAMHLFWVLTRIPVSMNATACYFVNGMESETSAIARGLRRRDPDLLDRLIEQYQHRLLRYLVSLTADRAIAEDLFQETWMRVLERGDQYDGRPPAFAEYLFFATIETVCTVVIVWQAWTWSGVKPAVSSERLVGNPGRAIQDQGTPI